MIRYFRKTQITYLLLLTFSTTVSSLLLFPLKWTNSSGDINHTAGLFFFQHPVESAGLANFVFFLAIIVSGIISGAFAIRLARKEFKKILNILYEECNPQKYLEHLSPLLTRGEKNSSVKRTIQSNYAVGLSASGDNEAAIQMMEDLLTRPMKKRFLIVKAIFYRNASMYYCQNSYNLMKAKEMLQKGKEILLQNQDNRLYENYKIHFYDAENIILFYEGDYQTTLKHFANALVLAKSKYSKVNTNFMLARIYEKLGDITQQKERLNFVAEEGNSLQIAIEARELLKRIN